MSGVVYVEGKRFGLLGGVRGERRGERRKKMT